MNFRIQQSHHKDKILAAATNLPFEILNNKGRPQRDSRGIVLGGGANELVVGVVGHAGSGTSTVAETLAKLLRQTKVGDDTFDVELIGVRLLWNDGQVGVNSRGWAHLTGLRQTLKPGISE
jgi:hypothetical protein